MKGSKPCFSDFEININKELCRNFNQITKTLCTFIFCLKNLSLETLQPTNKTKTWKAIHVTIILHKILCGPLVFLIVRPPSKFDSSDNFVSKNPAQI